MKYKTRITGDDLKPLEPAAKKVLVSRSVLQKRGDILVVPAHLFSLLDIGPTGS